MDHGPHLCMDAPPLPLLHGIVKDEERRPRVPTVGPLDLGSSLGVRVVVDLNQRQDASVPTLSSVDPSRDRNSYGAGGQ